MPELKNTFSWSISAMHDFEECHRRRFWAKYGMWGGWKDGADPRCRAAYRLSKMENRFTLLGTAVEQAVMWTLRRVQNGECVMADQAYDEVARPFLNKRWLESRKRMWEANPKKFCCLHEHYYPDHHRTPEKEMTGRMADCAKQCISNFLDKTAPGLKDVAKDWELDIATMERGDPESLEIDGVKVYAIPDYAYRREDEIHIHDWKSGRPKMSHGDQMAVYGTWAVTKHGGTPNHVHSHLEYLLDGETRSTVIGEADLKAAHELISRSVSEMTEYLVDCDMVKNIPLSMDHWEMSADEDACRRCNFYELCKPEL